MLPTSALQRDCNIPHHMTKHARRKAEDRDNVFRCCIPLPLPTFSSRHTTESLSHLTTAETPHSRLRRHNARTGRQHAREGGRHVRHICRETASPSAQAEVDEEELLLVGGTRQTEHEVFCAVFTLHGVGGGGCRCSGDATGGGVGGCWRYCTDVDQGVVC